MNKFFQKHAIAGVLLSLLLTLLIGVLVWLVVTRGNNAEVAIPFLREPLVLTLAGAILTYLVVDRWRRIETDIAELRKLQATALSEIKEDAERLAKERVDVTMRRAQAIETRMGGLLEDYPWIASLNEHDFIPDAPSCRIVLETARDLADQGKRSILYEYLTGWLDGDPAKPKLQGTVEDFLDLADFCERELGDEYLGFLIVREAYSHASNRLLAAPDYLHRLTRHGELPEARRVASYLRNALRPDWLLKAPSWVFDTWERLRGVPVSKYRYHKAVFVMRGYSSLSLYQELIGHNSRAQQSFEKAFELASKMGAEMELECVKAERLFIIGHFDEALAVTARLRKGTESDDVRFAAERIEKSIRHRLPAAAAASKPIEQEHASETKHRDSSVAIRIDDKIIPRQPEGEISLEPIAPAQPDTGVVQGDISPEKRPSGSKELG